jgi:hypothetical protein
MLKKIIQDETPKAPPPAQEKKTLMKCKGKRIKTYISLYLKIIVGINNTLLHFIF